jgi:hypothetical protein
MLTGAWILALVLTGAPLLAFAGGGDADAQDGDDDGAPPQDDGLDEVQGVAGPDEDPPDEEALPTDYEFVLGRGGAHDIAAFRPGTDTLTLTSDTWDFDLYDLGDDGTGAALEIHLGETRSILRFPGLAVLPVDDVHLHVAAPGQEPQRIALRDALEPDEGDVLDPADPDAPDDLPADAADASPIAPSDPDAPDAPPAHAGPEDVLMPTDPDTPEA